MQEYQKPESTVEACCSFCGKQQHQVERLTAGPGGVFICNECVDHVQKVLEENGTTTLFGAPSLFFLRCPSCGASCRRTDHYCFGCGQKLEPSAFADG